MAYGITIILAILQNYAQNCMFKHRFWQEFVRNGFSNIKLNPILPNIQVGKRNQPNSIAETLPNMAAPGCLIRPLVRTVFIELWPYQIQIVSVELCFYILYLIGFIK